MPEKKRILIDTDIAMGLAERDVDDGLAITMALNSKDLIVDGITLTYGNDSLSNTETCMENLLNKLSTNALPVKKGASSKDDLNKETDATQFICSNLKEKKLTIVSIGPLTNIASAINLCENKENYKNIEEIIVVAGRQKGQRFLTGNHETSHPDLNFERDPEAMQILIDSGIPITMAPFEVSSKVWFNQAVIEQIKKKETELANYIAIHSQNWLSFWNKTFSTNLHEIKAFNPFDTLAIAWLTDRDLLSYCGAELKIEDSNYDLTDKTVQGSGSAQKPYLHARLNQKDSDLCPYKYIYDVSREKFLERLISRLG